MVVQEDGNGITADALMVKTNVKLVICLSLETIILVERLLFIK